MKFSSLVGVVLSTVAVSTAMVSATTEDGAYVQVAADYNPEPKPASKPSYDKYDSDNGYGKKKRERGYDQTDDGYGKKDDSDDGYGKKKDDSDNGGYGKKKRDYSDDGGYGKKKDYKDDNKYGKDSDDYDKAKKPYKRDDNYGKDKDYNKSAKVNETKSKGALEYKQFWNTIDYCKAELALTECLLDCNVVKTFATTERVTNCIEKFAHQLCRNLDKDGCDNGRVSIKPKTCVNDAVVAALYTIDEIQSVTIGDDRTPVNLFRANHPDTFTSIKLALSMRAMSNYGTCVGGSLLNYASTCNGKQYFDKESGKCVNHILNSCDGEHRQEMEKVHETDIDDILTTVTDNEDEEKSEVELLSDIIKGAKDVKKFEKIHVTMTNHKHSSNQATLKVCPNYHVPLNFKFAEVLTSNTETASAVGGLKPEYLPDIPGFPLKDIAFHFPSETYDSEKKEWSPSKYDVSEGANKFQAGTLYDPPTPKNGIADTCNHFYTLSAIAWFAGEDTGDYCFTYDKYSVEFLENGEKQDLSYSPSRPKQNQCTGKTSVNTFPEYATLVDAKTALEATLNNEASTPQQKAQASSQLALLQAQLIGATPRNNPSNNCATCYNTKWNDPSYCPHHLSRWNMHLRCCKGFKTVQEEYQKRNSKYKPLKCGEKRDDVSCSAPKEITLEFEEVVHSAITKGELQRKSEFYHTYRDGVANKAFHLYSLFTGAKKFTTDQVNALKAALQFFNCDPSKLDLLDLFDKEVHGKFVPDAYDHEDRGHEHIYYVGHRWSQESCDRLKVKVEWESIIALYPESGKCYAPTCLISRFVDCTEHPMQKPVIYGGYSDNYAYRALLSATDNSSTFTLGAAGFVGGMVVMFIVNLVVKRLKSHQTEASSSPYNRFV